MEASAPIGSIEVQLAVMARNIELLRRRGRAPVELDRSAYLILRAVRQFEHVDINGLAAVLGLDSSTVGRQVGVLADENLVSRGPDEEDRRRALITITDDGLRRLDLTASLRRERMGMLLDGWSGDELERFGDLLAKYNAAVATTYMTGMSSLNQI